MEVLLRTNSKVDPAPFLELLERLYGTHKSVLTAKSEAYLITIHPKNPAQEFVTATHIAVMLGGVLRAHAVAFCDTRMQGVLFVGHVECEEGSAARSALFDAIDDVAHTSNVHTITGPVDGNLWRTFRAPMSGTDAPFFSEPFSIPSVSASFTASGYVLAQESETTRAHVPVQALSPTADGIVCVRAQPPEFERLLPGVHKIITQSFADTPYFIAITLPEFAFLFSAHKKSSDRTLLYVATHAGAVVGFLLAYRSPEAEPAGVVAKTMAILPEFRHKGIARALFASMYQDSLAEGFENVYYSTMRTDNADIFGLTKHGAEAPVLVRTYGVFMKTL